MVPRRPGDPNDQGAVAQLGERGLCKPEVVGSIPISSTSWSLQTHFLVHLVHGVPGPKQAGSHRRSSDPVARDL